MLWTFLSLLAIAVGYYLFKELTGVYKIYKYKSQGIKRAEYLPMPLMISKMKKAHKSNDVFAGEKKMMADQDPNQPFGVKNFGPLCFLSLISEKAIKDFYAQEIEATIKKPISKEVKFLGFLFENGKEVQEKRAIFAKIFHYSNVLNLMPNMRNVVKQHVSKLRKRVLEEGGQVKIDLKKEFSRALLDDLSACILLGGTENKMVDKFEGMNITQIIQNIFSLLRKSKRNLVNFLPFVTSLGFNKQLNEVKRLKQGLIGIIRKQYNKRYNKEALLEESALDIMIKLNKDSEKRTGKPRFSMEEITSNFELFQFAASDTSFHLSSTIITYLALPENQVYQKRVQTEVDSEVDLASTLTNEQLNSMKEVDIVFKEAARLANPVAGISRIATKDFKLDGHTVYKGDIIINILANYEPKHFKDPLKFNPDRFDTKSSSFRTIPRLKQIPFSTGQRGCLGKHLGEMVVKLIIVELLKEFEVSVEPGYAIKFKQDPLYGVVNPDLIMKVRTTG